MLFESWFEIKTKKKSPEYFSNTTCKENTQTSFIYIKSQFIAKITKKIVVHHCMTVIDGRQEKSSNP